MHSPIDYELFSNRVNRYIYWEVLNTLYHSGLDAVRMWAMKGYSIFSDLQNWWLNDRCRLEFELPYFKVTIQHLGQYATCHTKDTSLIAGLHLPNVFLVSSTEQRERERERERESRTSKKVLYIYIYVCVCVCVCVCERERERERVGYGGTRGVIIIVLKQTSVSWWSFIDASMKDSLGYNNYNNSRNLIKA